MIEQLFTADALDPAWFAPAFSVRVPLGEVDRVRRELVAAHGAWRGAERQGGARWLVALERARVPVRLTLDDQGRVASLLLDPPAVVAASLEAAVAAFDALPGQVGLLVLEDGAERVARHPDTPLGAGSAFKLLVLRELAAAVAAGRLAWSTTVALRPGWRSPGSGMLRDWPEGLPVSVGSLAALMMAQSDNTATGALMDLIGRRHLDAAAAPCNRPLLTPRELLGLRYAGGTGQLADWRSGDAARRRRMLEAFRPGEDLPDAVPGQVPADIDYLFTARELCGLIASVAELPLTRINPGVADGLGWDWAAFKSGTTTTSASLTVLAARGMRRVCVAALWNAAPAVDRARLRTITRSLLATIAVDA